MTYERPEFTVVGEAAEVVLGCCGMGDDDADQTSTDTPLPLGLEE